MNDNTAEQKFQRERVPLWYLILSVVALCALSMIWGGLAVCHGFFPGPALRSAYEAAKALKIQREYDRMPYSLDLWFTNRFGPASGVTRWDRSRACPGYTLYTSGHIQGAFLIDLDGRVLHQWHLPYNQVWEPSAGVHNPRPPHQIFWFKAHVFPNGDLLAVVEGNGSTPWGHGLIKMDRDSRLIWKFLEPAHHDFSIGEDGRIYALTHRMRTTPLPGLAVYPPCLEDFVVVLSPDGKKLDELSLLEAFRDSRFRWPFNEGATRSPFGEYTHANAARVITSAMATVCPFARPGQVLVSMPILQSSLALVDLTTRRVEWLRFGGWRAQHDPDILDNGHWLIFDNWGHMGLEGWSRVIEYDPLNDRIVWSYVGHTEDPFFTRKRGGQNRLPNGNTLIAESDEGRLLEVTPEGDVVWEFINPARGGTNGQLIAVISTGERLPPTYFTEEFREYLARRTAQEGNRHEKK